MSENFSLSGVSIVFNDNRFILSNPEFSNIISWICAANLIQASTASFGLLKPIPYASLAVKAGDIHFLGHSLGNRNEITRFPFGGFVAQCHITSL